MSESNPRQNVTFASNGGQAHGYLAKPESGSGPGLVVIQEWWGLDDHMADIVDRFAAEGFVALAPDLFGGKVAHDSDEAGALMEQLPVDQAARDLGGAVDYLLADDAVTSSKVGAVGFCMGGGFVLQLAAQQGDKIGAAVPFYGVGRRRAAGVLGHLRARSRVTTPRRTGSTRSTRPASRSSRCAPRPRPTWSSSTTRPVTRSTTTRTSMGTYDEQAAAQAWQRTVEFLKANLT